MQCHFLNFSDLVRGLRIKVFTYFFVFTDCIKKLEVWSRDAIFQMVVLNLEARQCLGVTGQVTPKGDHTQTFVRHVVIHVLFLLLPVDARCTEHGWMHVRGGGGRWMDGLAW